MQMARPCWSMSISLPRMAPPRPAPGGKGHAKTRRIAKTPGQNGAGAKRFAPATPGAEGAKRLNSEEGIHTRLNLPRVSSSFEDNQSGPSQVIGCSGIWMWVGALGRIDGIQAQSKATKRPRIKVSGRAHKPPE